jgi:hypothetical protein
MASNRSARLIGSNRASDDLAEPIDELNRDVYNVHHLDRYQEAIARATQARDLGSCRLTDNRERDRWGFLLG